MKPVLSVRDLKYSDIPTCLKMMQQNYSEQEDSFWSNVLVKDLSDILEGDKLYRSKCLVVMRDEIMVGFGCFMQSKMAHNIYEVAWINILTEYQNRGIGKYLLIEIEKNICKDEMKSGDGFLIMFETDKPYFYEKLGYKTVHKIGKDDIMIKSCSLQTCTVLFTQKGYKDILKCNHPKLEKIEGRKFGQSRKFNK